MLIYSPLIVSAETIKLSEEFYPMKGNPTMQITTNADDSARLNSRRLPDDEQLAAKTSAAVRPVSPYAKITGITIGNTTINLKEAEELLRNQP